MVKCFLVLLAYNFCWNEGNNRLQSMAKFSLVLGTDLVPETLCISVGGWQLLSAGMSQTVLLICSCFQHTVHTPQLHFSGSCWCHPGCSNQHTPRRPRPEGPLQKETGPCGSCFPWDQCVPISRDEKSCFSRPKCLCHLYSQRSVLLSVFSLLNTQKPLGSSLLILTFGKFLPQGMASLAFILTDQLCARPEVSCWEKESCCFFFSL